MIRKVIFLLALAVCAASAQKIQHVERRDTRAVLAATSCLSSAPCSTGSMNFAWDSAGSPCAGSWGNCSAIQLPVTFNGVPSGAGLVVKRVYGDTIAFARAPVQSGQQAGVLWGAWSSTALSTTATVNGADVANSSCFWYDQGALGSGVLNSLFDRDNLFWPMASDNTLTIQLAQFLNDTGASVHVELTITIQYYYQ